MPELLGVTELRAHPVSSVFRVPRAVTVAVTVTVTVGGVVWR